MRALLPPSTEPPRGYTDQEWARKVAIWWASPIIGMNRHFKTFLGFEQWQRFKQGEKPTKRTQVVARWKPVPKNAAL